MYTFYLRMKIFDQYLFKIHPNQTDYPTYFRYNNENTTYLYRQFILLTLCIYTTCTDNSHNLHTDRIKHYILNKSVAFNHSFDMVTPKRS